MFSLNIKYLLLAGLTYHGGGSITSSKISPPTSSSVIYSLNTAYGLAELLCEPIPVCLNDAQLKWNKCLVKGLRNLSIDSRSAEIYYNNK